MNFDVKNVSFDVFDFSGKQHYPGKQDLAISAKTGRFCHITCKFPQNIGRHREVWARSGQNGHFVATWPLVQKHYVNARNPVPLGQGPEMHYKIGYGTSHPP